MAVADVTSLIPADNDAGPAASSWALVCNVALAALLAAGGMEADWTGSVAVVSAVPWLLPATLLAAPAFEPWANLWLKVMSDRDSARGKLSL